MLRKFKNFELAIVYTIVFTTLILWSSFAYLTMSQMIQSQKNYAKIINISGKQRMFSQRTALFSKIIYNSDDTLKNEEFAKMVQMMKADHQYLIDNLTSEHMRKIYFEEPHNVNFQVNKYFNLLTSYQKDKTSLLLKQIEETSNKLLKPLNYAVYEFEKESDQKIEKLKTRELLIYIGTLITLILEAFFIVIPSIRSLKEKEKKLASLNSSLEERVKEQTKDIEKQKNELIVLNDSLEQKVKERTQELDITTKKIENIYKHMTESIRYASLIQRALMPDEEFLESMFKDSFVYWIPKDTVGGDIWLSKELRHEDECLLFYIDCTGHGVPGAFITMLIKAIKREIITKIIKAPSLDVSTSWIMAYFNKTMKTLLKQQNRNSISNAGFDGGIIYYNKRTQILKFSGAQNSLFYMDTQGKLITVKGDRYSVGYKKCDMNYQYKETTINVQEGMKFYCTTDGYLDQNGGKKDFPFGKRRFKNIIQEHHSKNMASQKDIFVDTLLKYEQAVENSERIDDITLIGFEIGSMSNYHEDKIEEIVQYSGVVTQNVIAASLDNIESKIEKVNLMGTISTITIECYQNMMHYAKNDDIDSRQIVPAGSIDVQHINDDYYKIIAKNIVSIEDKQKMEHRLQEISQLDRAAIRKRYRELRKSGEHTHDKGGGIGMYEIAKVSDTIEYTFEQINESKYYFTMISIVK